MSYSISAETLIGALTLHRDTVDAAVKKARELREGGMWNIRIADEANGSLIQENIDLPPPDLDSRH